MSTLNMIEKIKNYINSSTDEIIALQQLLTSIPAISPESGGTGEYEKAKALESWLLEKGFKNIQWFNAPDKNADGGIRPNLLLTIAGKNSCADFGKTDERKNAKCFWIMSHIDVVPPGEISLWQSDPYKIKIDGDKIYGRGVEDNQQGLAASIFAALSLINNNIIPEYDVKLLFVADEEMGSSYGIKYLLDNFNLFKKHDFALVPDSGDAEGKTIEIAEKNLLWLKVTTTGKQCHASRPDLGVNAFAASSQIICKLAEIKNEINDYNPIFDPPYSTITPTKKEANVPNINTMPGEDVFYIDCRILPETGSHQVMRCLEKIFAETEKAHNVKIRCEAVQNASSPATSENSKIVALLKKAIKKANGQDAKVVGIGGGTVAACLRNAGIDAAVWSTIEETAHTPNEYCKISNIKNDALVMALLMAGIE